VNVIRQRVAEEHGIQLHAVSVLSLGALPKTSSGKVRRHATRSGYADGSLGEVHRWTRPVLVDRSELVVSSDRMHALSVRS
jgi:acyl-CoA synthetase (AMP-forming)/AMP-acid ligase II